MAAVLVVGASRGIGAELVRQYLAAGWQVHATMRDPQPAGAAVVHRLDVRDPADLAALAAELREAKLDLAIHNAGVYRGASDEELAAVNTAAPLRVVEALLEGGCMREGAVAAFMSSGMGSRRGRPAASAGYGESKARMNDAVRARAPGWRARFGVTCVVLNPGWVRTDMGGPSAPLAVEDSVAGIRRVLAAVRPAGEARFLGWDGSEQPW